MRSFISLTISPEWKAESVLVSGFGNLSYLQSIAQRSRLSSGLDYPRRSIGSNDSGSSFVYFICTFLFCLITSWGFFCGQYLKYYLAP